MNQNIICKVTNCGFCSPSGFCLKKLTVINNQGVCDYITREGWDRQVEDWEKNTYREPREPDQNLVETGEKEENDENRG